VYNKQPTLTTDTNNKQPTLITDTNSETVPQTKQWGFAIAKLKYFLEVSGDMPFTQGPTRSFRC
jgi:hypothetical protein